MKTHVVVNVRVVVLVTEGRLVLLLGFFGSELI